MAAPTTSTRDQVLSYLSDPRFSQELTLPATADSPALTVSYADVGFTPEPADSRSTPTMLFIPGMFGSRYISSIFDPIARKLGVRVLVADRPGMGHSTEVPFATRISTWIRTVPLLLAHLDIKHVALVSHSAGTIYLLNTLHHHRDILHPDQPFVALLAPWVDPAHSKVTSMQLMQYIPAQVFSVWHHIAPLLATSGVVVNKASSIFPSTSSNAKDTPQEKNRQKLVDKYDVSRDFQIERESLAGKLIMKENTVGANSEALLCARKGEGWSWGECDDYATFVETLATAERQKRQMDSGTESHGKLKVRAYFAENDIMVGVGGQKYMEDCWGRGEGSVGDVLDFDSATIADTDHDSLVMSVEVLEKVLTDAGGSLAG
ncbi:Alpha/Beta hydrolase protein [Trichoderma sp. SZMC 28014]